MKKLLENQKKNRKNMSKTDPNLFLFGPDEDIENTSIESSSISDLNNPIVNVEIEDDLEVPSYLRKGNI